MIAAWLALSLAPVVIPDGVVDPAATTAVLVVDRGIEAVDLYMRRKEDIALVVMDLGLPNMNGSAALRAMKRTTPHVKAIVATAYLPSQAEASQWDAVILKPYKLDDVLQQISRVIRES